jgi:hypothetical protein
VEEQRFDAVVAERTHLIEIPAHPDEVFPLFGPLREADWAAGWEPEIVAGDAALPEAGCVFRTRDESRGETIWLVSRVDHVRHRIAYVRTTPRSDLAEIRIAVDAAPGGGASVSVTYRLTGLSPDGNAYVADFTEDRYRSLIDEWAVAIGHYLETGAALNTAL